MMAQTRTMRIYSQMAECSPSYAKMAQTRAMRIYSQMAECNPSYAKIIKSNQISRKYDKNEIKR